MPFNSGRLLSANSWPNIDERYWFMDIRLLYSSARSARYRFLATGSLVVFMATTVMRVDAQQLVPFGDVPATENFSEAEIATRGRQPDRPLTYTPWRKACFKATREAGSKMVCRTTINGRWDTGQIALRVDLIEREADPVARLQIFVAPGSFLQPGFIHDLETGQMLALETVNSNVLGVINSVPLQDFAEVHRGHRRKCLSRGL